MAQTDINNLVAWGRSRGLVMDGIRPLFIKGKGYGMVATRDIARGEVVLNVPCGLARTVESTPAWILEQFTEASCESILAVALCTETSPDFQYWAKTLPTLAHIDACYPIRWHRDLKRVLPYSTRQMLNVQEQKFEYDWATVKDKISGLTRQDFMHAWIIVNTHSFHHRPNMKREGHADLSALVPVADLFNHNPLGGCSARQEGSQYIVRAVKDYCAGEELQINYGQRNNDYFFVEYGFLLADEDNLFDESSLDEVIHRSLEPDQIKWLRERGMYCQYNFNSQEISPRAGFVIRALTRSYVDWPDLLNGTLEITPQDRDTFSKCLDQILTFWDQDIARFISQLDCSSQGNPISRDLIRARWCQVRKLIATSTANAKRFGWT